MIRENIAIAFSQLRAGKMRTFLTTLGITIGIATVIFIVSVLEGYNASITSELNILGANTFQVQKHELQSGIQMGHGRRAEYRKDLKKELADALRNNCDLIESVGAEVWQYGQSVIYKDKKTNPNLMIAGGDPEFFINNGYFVKDGRMLIREDVAARKRLAIIGMDAIDVLFPFEDPMDKIIKISGTKFHVIGILEKMGNTTFGQSRDNVVIIPISTFEDIWGKNRSVNLTFRVKQGVDFVEAQNQVIGVLRAERKVPPGKDNDFAIFSNETLIDSFNNIARQIKLVAVLLGMIALVVGSIGVMNIMLVTVTERTREIGIRKAVGAKRALILLQFLSESIVLSLIGGFIGMLLGFGSAGLVSAFLKVPMVVPLWVVVISIMVTSVVGLLAGLYPAMRAAKMDPINALRYE